jgi:hypothetical protein
MAVTRHLSSEDMHWVETVARQRQDEAVRAGRPDRHGYRGSDGYALHRLGAAGELVVARFLEVPWEATVNTFKAPDIGDILQIRTRSEHWHDLIIRPDDSDDEVFVLVTGEPPELIIHGWIVGRDAKQSQWRNEHGGRPMAYFVPKIALQQLV